MLKLSETDLFYVPSVLDGVLLAVRALLKAGDRICMNEFEVTETRIAIAQCGVKIGIFSFEKVDTGYCINWEDLELQISKSKALLLSNPHNPTGTAFSEADLRRILDLCNKYSLYVLVDEIWCDLVFDPAKHTPALSLQQKNVFAFYAASKSFNIAGLHMAVTVAQDPELQQRFNDQLLAMHMTTSNCFGIHGFIAALTECDRWLAEFRRELCKNMNACVEFFNQHMPLVRAYMPQATSLLWLDFSALFATCEEAEQFCVDHGVCLQSRGVCLQGGLVFVRMDCACNLNQLVNALQQLKQGYDARIEKQFAGYAAPLTKIDLLGLAVAFPGVQRQQIAVLAAGIGDYWQAHAKLQEWVLDQLDQIANAPGPLVQVNASN